MYEVMALRAILRRRHDLVGGDVEVLSENKPTWRGPIKSIELKSYTLTIVTRWIAEYRNRRWWSYKGPNEERVRRITCDIRNAISIEEDPATRRITVTVRDRQIIIHPLGNSGNLDSRYVR